MAWKYLIDSHVFVRLTKPATMRAMSGDGFESSSGGFGFTASVGIGKRSCAVGA
jgi:hypothetical protein